MDYSSIKKIAIIVGHEVAGKDKGTVNYLGETESSFNYRIACKLQEKIKKNKKLNSHIFLRDDIGIAGVAKDVGGYKPDLCIELHFNAFHTPILGCEALCLNELNSIHLADIVTDKLETNMGIRQRHNGKGILVINFPASGYRNLKLIQDQLGEEIPKIIIEPCFANFKTKDSEAVFENEDEYVRVLFESIRLYFNLEDHVYLPPSNKVLVVQPPYNPLKFICRLIKQWTSY